MGLGKRWDKMDKRKFNLREIVQTYELHNRSEGKSPGTIRWYTQKLNTYLDWLGASTLKNFTPDSVREFLLFLQAKNRKFENNPFTPPKEGKLSTYTVHGYALTLKAFASWLYEEGYTKENVLGRLKRPKVAKVVPQGLNQEEIEALLSSFDRKATIGARDYALTVTFLDTGARCSELCTLTLENADLEYGELKVMGKGKKERKIPIGTRAISALRKYRNHFRPDVKSSHFFVGLDGQPLTTGAVQQMISKAKKRAGIPRLHVHLLRHTFAIQYLMAGGDAFSLQKILGHTTMDVTRNYVNMIEGQVKEKHRRFSPMDNLNLKEERTSKKPIKSGKRLWAVIGLRSR